MVGERQLISYDMKEPGDKILTKYTNAERKEITLTIKSVCRSLIKDIFNYDSEEGMKEIKELCFKMIEKENLSEHKHICKIKLNIFLICKLE